jgi:conjugal transfer pilus assembly protein TraA
MTLTMNSSNKKMAFGLALMLAAGAVVAGTTGAEFLSLYTLVFGWTTGYLGKAIAIGAFLIGAFAGFAKSTIMPALIGLGFALLFAIGPGVIDGIVTALI